MVQCTWYNINRGTNMMTGNNKINTKKYLIVLVLRILETNSDEFNPLTQTTIAKLISEVYPCDRKTVGRNIKFLNNLGYPIVKTTKGFYMDNKTFSFEELKYIEDAIRNFNTNSPTDKDVLINKLMNLLRKQYKR